MAHRSSKTQLIVPQPARRPRTLSIFIAGFIAALVAGLAVTLWLMRPASGELAALFTPLGLTAAASLGVGYLLYRLGRFRSARLHWTLLAGYGFSTLVTLAHVWIMARWMFLSEHDFALVTVLLLFAAIIATTFGYFASAALSLGVRELMHSAQALAGGNLAARAPVSGRDELAQLAQTFNDMAARLEAAAKKQKEVETLRRDLIAWTSHDLRTPLTSIRAMVEALADGVVSDPAVTARYLRTIRADVQSLNTLIDDLFELAQLDAGGLTLEVASHSLSDLISDSLESFRALADGRGVRLTGQVADQIDPVPMNAQKIGRVLANLLGNALRHTAPGGEVTVKAYRAKGDVCVEVRDTGEGIPPEDLERVFERFYRGDAARSRSRESSGAGLGLAIAKGIVEAHGGRIWAQNAEGGGARFVFVLRPAGDIIGGEKGTAR
ncbi:MAG: HAMP domain-containing histidine kinase [Chloroflexi bacterium]|nr:HAMP domain-containing histidine kinase [Chloroflexota bacterium]